MPAHPGAPVERVRPGRHHQLRESTSDWAFSSTFAARPIACVRHVEGASVWPVPWKNRALFYRGRPAGAGTDPRRLEHHDRGTGRRSDPPRRLARRPWHAERRRQPDQHHHPQPRLPGHLRLLPAVGAQRRRPRQLERPLRQHLAARQRPRLDRPQPVRGRGHGGRDAPRLLRPDLPGPRRAARHHQRLRPRHRLLERVRGPRQGRCSSARPTAPPPTAASCASPCITTCLSRRDRSCPARAAGSCSDTPVPLPGDHVDFVARHRLA